MKFCKSCGARMSPTAKVCASCNTPIDAPDAGAPGPGAAAAGSAGGGGPAGGEGGGPGPKPGAVPGAAWMDAGDLPTHRNNAIKYALLGLEVLKLNRKAMAAVASDEDATAWAVIVIALGLFVPPLIDFPPHPIVSLVMGFFGTFATLGAMALANWLAQLMGGQGLLLGFIRVLGLAHVATWIAVVPIVGVLLRGLATLYLAYVYVVTIQEVHGLDLVKSIVVVIVTGVVLSIAGGILFAVLGTTLLVLLGVAASVISH